jgi:hypothetical protein
MRSRVRETGVLWRERSVGCPVTIALPRRGGAVPYRLFHPRERTTAPSSRDDNRGATPRVYTGHMASLSDEDRRKNRRFWLGIAGFIALLVVILGLGLVCAGERPPDDPSPNANVERVTSS